MSKKRNRNRSARKTATAPSTGSVKERAREYSQKIRSLVRNAGWPAYLRDGADLDELRQNRKTNAAIRLLDEFRKMGKQLNMEFNADAIMTWLQICLGPTTGTDILDQQHFISLAAAIWILDRLAECGRFEDACRLFPQDPQVYENENWPNVRDLCHEERALRGMMWIIQHRNDDCIGLPGKVSSRTMVDDYTAARLQHQDVPSRQRFRTILDMIPDEILNDAITAYTDSFHDVMNRILRSHQIIMDCRNELHLEYQTVNQTARSLVMEAFEDGRQLQESIAAVMAQEPSSQTPLPDYHFGHDIIENRLRSRSLYDQGTSLDDEERLLSTLAYAINGLIYGYHTTSRAEREKRYTPEICAIWDDFTIDDPYVLCFAYMFLLDQNSDLPWIYGVSNSLMGFCANALPWRTIFDPFGEDDESCLFLEPEDLEYASLYSSYYSDRIAPDSDQAVRLNLPQIIYQRTGYILPRTLIGGNETELWLNRFGLLDSPFNVELCSTIGLLIAHANRTMISAPPPEEKTESESPEVLHQRIRELEQEKKALLQEAYESNREAKKLREELTAMREDYTAEHQELSELRELIFRMDTDAVEDTSPPNVEFPCRTTGKIVVFGGHPTWYKEICCKLPDVRFYRHTNPDPGMIRNADEIWFQTNAISHALYRTVTNHLVGCHTKIHYFHHASATKCAEELVAAQSA